MADNYPICLPGAMDRLWFHQTILFSESTSLLPPKILKPPQLINEESITCSSSNISQSTHPEEEFSSNPSSAIFSDQDDSNNEDDEMRVRPTRLDLVNSKSRSSSSSPSTKKSSRNLRYLGSVTRLQKTMSCKSLLELELEEVKGFMDLGFRFDTENLCPRMMSVLPGLQRIGELKNEQKTRFTIDAAEEKDKDDEIEEEGVNVMRPYLSEAWLIKRPDSPLLNLRIPKVSAAADMKKHLKYWARTVASVIQQES